MLRALRDTGDDEWYDGIMGEIEEFECRDDTFPDQSLSSDLL
jgi:hypothetical protein